MCVCGCVGVCVCVSVCVSVCVLVLKPLTVDIVELMLHWARWGGTGWGAVSTCVLMRTHTHAQHTTQNAHMRAYTTLILIIHPSIHSVLCTPREG